MVAAGSGVDVEVAGDRLLVGPAANVHRQQVTQPQLARDSTERNSNFWRLLSGFRCGRPLPYGALKDFSSCLRRLRPSLLVPR